MSCNFVKEGEWIAAKDFLHALGTEMLIHHLSVDALSIGRMNGRVAGFFILVTAFHRLHSLAGE